MALAVALQRDLRTAAEVNAAVGSLDPWPTPRVGVCESSAERLVLTYNFYIVRCLCFIFVYSVLNLRTVHFM